MPFISAADGFVKKSFTDVENKFITKYLPVLDPLAVKVYLYALYLCQSGYDSYTLGDLAASLEISEEKAEEYFKYLEEFELVSIVSTSPFEVKIMEAENLYGKPKKYKPEKYADFTKNAQNILSGRMISVDEYREYFYFMEDGGFDEDALIMIINYCVSLKDNAIGFNYIKKVIKSFAQDKITTAKKVDERLSDYTSATPALLKLFTELSIHKKPDISDDKYYKKWTTELGFEDEAIICAAKNFKVKSCDKIDLALEELYKNKKFDVREIQDYCKNKNSLFTLALNIAKNLGVYMQNSAPYVQNYVSVWCNYGYSFYCLEKISSYCFKNGKNSFEDMNGFITSLYDEGIITDESVNEYIETKIAQDKLLKKILETCGLSRKVVTWDRESLVRWKSWNFSDGMLLEAAKLSSGKSNPLAYMNAILSAWKSQNVYTADKISSTANVQSDKNDLGITKAKIEQHFYELRNKAEDAAEAALAKATSDATYGTIRRELNELSIELAFAEIKSDPKVANISKKIAELEKKGDKRLAELNINKSDFTPNYSCKICNDSGYTQDGKPCVCMKKFIEDIKI